MHTAAADVKMFSRLISSHKLSAAQSYELSTRSLLQMAIGNSQLRERVGLHFQTKEQDLQLQITVRQQDLPILIVDQSLLKPHQI